jgi:protease I
MRLAGSRLGIFTAEGVEDLEFHVVRMRLLEEGAEVIALGGDTEPHRGKNGLVCRADALAADVGPTGLDGLVIPGGWAPDKLRRDPAVVGLTRAVHDLGLPIGIICHGGLVAISADIVRGARATGSLGIRDDLVNAGAVWVDEPAFREGTHVWGRVVADIPHFTREFVALLVERAGG